VAEVPGRDTATVLLNRSGQSLTRLYVGLQVAVTDGRYPPAPAGPSPAAAALGRAADAAGVAADILASHLLPWNRRPSPEGVAIRAGGGVPAALGDVAELALELLAVDARLVDWLDDQDPIVAETYRPVLEAAWWAIGGRLADAANDLVAAAAGHPRLLDELEMTRQPLDVVSAVTTVTEAIAAVTAARDWLWQHRDQLFVEHLQLATRLGLQVHSALEADGPGASGPRLNQWRAAADAAARLRGSPADSAARTVTLELAEALRWVGAQAGPDNRTADRPSSPQGLGLARLGERMPALANTLYAGLQDAVRRGDVFVPDGDAVLAKPRGSLVFRAVQTWRRANNADDPVRAVGQVLTALSRSAASAFPSPPRPSPASRPRPVPTQTASPAIDQRPRRR
jgi:hypothetical protein